MKSKELYSVINQIDDDLIESAMVITPVQKVIHLRRYAALAACLCIMLVGIVMVNNHSETDFNMDLTERIIIDSNAPKASAIVNFKGKIVEVGKDGLSFKLDDGKWVTVNDETTIGITAPTAAAKDEQLFESTFRVGNSISGFSLEANKRKIIADTIYTNWNWDNPIR